MSLFSFKKKVANPPDSGEVSPSRRTIKRSPPVAMEVKLLALEGLASGLSAEEVGELAGVGVGTVHKWRQAYAEGGVEGRRPSCSQAV